jgi:hypothetical protein
MNDIEALIDRHIFDVIRHRLEARAARGEITRDRLALWLASLDDVEKQLIEEAARHE